jgi:hypothetical protein
MLVAWLHAAENETDQLRVEAAIEPNTKWPWSTCCLGGRGHKWAKASSTQVSAVGSFNAHKRTGAAEADLAEKRALARARVLGLKLPDPSTFDATKVHGELVAALVFDGVVSRPVRAVLGWLAAGTERGLPASIATAALLLGLVDGRRA